MHTERRVVVIIAQSRSNEGFPRKRRLGFQPIEHLYYTWITLWMFVLLTYSKQMAPLLS